MRGAAAGVTEGISRAARKAERPSELVAPRPAHRWPRGAAAPRILARHTSAPQRPARGDRQPLGPAESRENGAGARLGPHRVRGHRCGRLKRLQGGRFPKETSRAMRRRRAAAGAASVLPRRQPPSIRATEADAARPPSGCCPAARRLLGRLLPGSGRMLPGRWAAAAAAAGQHPLDRTTPKQNLKTLAYAVILIFCDDLYSPEKRLTVPIRTCRGRAPETSPDHRTRQIAPLLCGCFLRASPIRFYRLHTGHVACDPLLRTLLGLYRPGKFYLH